MRRLSMFAYAKLRIKSGAKNAVYLPTHCQGGRTDRCAGFHVDIQNTESNNYLNASAMSHYVLWHAKCCESCDECDGPSSIYCRNSSLNRVVGATSSTMRTGLMPTTLVIVHPKIGALCSSSVFHNEICVCSGERLVGKPSVTFGYLDDLLPLP